MIKTFKRQLGDKGEEIARSYLEKNNYKIIETNFWKPWGELDIIAQLGQDIVFVEVKTKSLGISDKYGLPEEEVNFFKQQKLIRTANLYLIENNYPEDLNWQIDVISVFLNWKTRQAKLQHLKNAVYDGF